MNLVEELHEAALKVESFYGHGVAARLMREAAEKLRELMPVEVPVDSVAKKGEE
jgi:hypothetical protein